MDDCDILNFGHTGKISFKAALRDVRKTKPNISIKSPPTYSSSQDSSSYSSDCNDEDSGGRRQRRKRKHKVGGKEGSLASRLMCNKGLALEPCVIDSESEDDSDSSLGERKKAKKVIKSPKVSRDDSVSPSPSPEPSPPPPGSSFIETPSDRRSKRVLNKANNAIHQLIWSSNYSTPGSEHYSSDFNDSLIGSASKENITLRVRYRGKMHKFTVCRGDPFSLVCSMLASELDGQENSKFLLSHKTVTLKETDSPLSLGLTTADIIDAITMSETSAPVNTSASAGSLNLSTGENNITIKVQSSKKSMVYSLAKTDLLQKAMEAFAKELNVSIDKIKFSFDGDLISSSQTADDLDMEDDDCIDARVL